MDIRKFTNVHQPAHGGDIYSHSIDLDFSVSLNPLGMPKEVERALEGSIPSWSAYPDTSCSALRSELSSRLQVRDSAITFGSGAAELIYDLVYSLKPRKALLSAPTFSEYESALCTADCEINFFNTSENEDFRLDAAAFAAAVTGDTDLVFLCNPNNPTGDCLEAEDVRLIEKACHENGAFLCVDETFVELTEKPDEYSVLQDCRSDPQLAVIRAFTKTYALAGIRLGYLICYDDVLNERLRCIRQPWSVSSPAQCAGLAALRDVPCEYLSAARDMIASERERMSAELGKKGSHVIRSGANFILFTQFCDDLYGKCLDKGILLRDCQNFRGLGQGFLRIGLRTPDEDDRLLEVLETL